MNLTPNSYGTDLREANDCHNPAGSSEGGQFCSKSGTKAAPKGRKAEFEGECQLCGHRQLLPGGVLSNHGYAVQWNQFVGTCPGSRCKPFEQSTDRIETAITEALSGAERLRARAQELEKLPAPGTTEAFERVYYPTQGQIKGGYRWTRVTLSKTDNSWGPTFTSQVVSGEDPRRGFRDKEVHFDFANRPGSVEEAVQRLNSQYATTFYKQAEGLTEYAGWLRARVAGWKPRDLKPRAAAPPPVPPAQVKYRAGQWIYVPGRDKAVEVRSFSQGIVAVRIGDEWKRFKAEEVRKAW